MPGSSSDNSSILDYLDYLDRLRDSRSKETMTNVWDWQWQQCNFITIILMQQDFFQKRTMNYARVYKAGSTPIEKNPGLAGLHLSSWRLREIKRMVQCLYLLQVLYEYVDWYILDSHTHKGRHRDHGRDRAEYFKVNFVQVYIKQQVSTVKIFLKSCKNAPPSINLPARVNENNIILQLMDFVNKKGHYGNIRQFGMGAINVGEGSCFTYMLSALANFWSSQRCMLVSPTLSGFFQCLVVGRRLDSPGRVYSQEQDKQIYTSDLKKRAKLKSLIQWVSRKNLQCWALPDTKETTVDQPGWCENRSFRVVATSLGKSTLGYEADAVLAREGAQPSFIVRPGNKMRLQSNKTYIYVIYEDRFSGVPEMRAVVDALAYESGSEKEQVRLSALNEAGMDKLALEKATAMFYRSRVHSTLAHFGKFDAKLYKRCGVDPGVKVLMAGEIKTRHDPLVVVISNKSGHFRPGEKPFGTKQELIQEKLGTDYEISWQSVKL